MAYAEVADVLARAGRFGKAWTDTSSPSLDDIEIVLRSRAAEIDAALAGHGLSVPLTGVPGDALRSLNAAGALILLLNATALGNAADAVSGLLSRVEKEWDEGLLGISNGSFGAVMAATAGDASSGEANDFWSEEPWYGWYGWEGLPPDVMWDPDPYSPNPLFSPAFRRGEGF